jgi:hypothetical protein
MGPTATPTTRQQSGPAVRKADLAVPEGPDAAAVAGPLKSRSILAATVLLAATALVTGCGLTPPAEAEPLKNTPGTTSSTSSAPLQAAPKGNACPDAKDDATTNDLTLVTLKRDGDYLDVTWTMVKRETGAGAANFYLNVVSETGNASGQLGVRYLDGRQVAYPTFHDTNKEISGSAQTTPTSVTASFPMSELEQVGPNFTWQGATSGDDNDMDACPAVGSLHPQRFAG